MLYFLVALVILFIGFLKFPRKTFISRYCLNLLLSVDQLANTILLGDPDETLSSRIGKGSLKGSRFCIFMAKILGFFDKNHAVKNIEKDEGSDQITKT